MRLQHLRLLLEDEQLVPVQRIADNLEVGIGEVVEVNAVDESAEASLIGMLYGNNSAVRGTCLGKLGLYSDHRRSRSSLSVDERGNGHYGLGKVCLAGLPTVLFEPSRTIRSSPYVLSSPR